MELNKEIRLIDGQTEMSFTLCMRGDLTANGTALPMAEAQVMQVNSKSGKIVGCVWIQESIALKIIDALKQLGYRQA